MLRIRTFLLLFCPLLVTPLRVKIGRVGNIREDARLATEEFWSHNSGVTLEPITQRIQWGNTLDVAVAVCKLAEMRVHALVLEGLPRLSSLVASYSEHMQIPSVGGTVNILPDTSEAAAHLVSQWKSFAFIYQTDTGANQLQKILRFLDGTPYVEAFWRTNSALETLDFIKYLPETPLLLSCSKSLTDELIPKLATLRRNFDIILLTPVGNVRKKLHPGSYRLVQFSFVDQKSSVQKSFENRWNTIKSDSNQVKDISDSTVINYEASKVLQAFFTKEEISSSMTQQAGSCFNYTAGIPPDALKEVVVQGSLTGDIKFNANGRRRGYVLDIYEERPLDLKKIGSWSDERGMHLLQNFVQSSPVSAAFQQGPPIRVTSVLVKPFLMVGSTGAFEGYVVDFLEELMAIIRQSYHIELVKDGGYGRKVGDSWSGMIGELVRDEADIAVAPLTKTQDREKVIDFSKTFMTFGLNILLKKPKMIQDEKSSFSPFSFLTVWSAEMWTVVVVLVAVFGGACYLVSRYIGSPDRVRALESKGTDNLSPCGSFWFTIASLVQRDTGIYPRTFSHRMWACLWWALCFFLTVGYVSYLSAALLQTRKSIDTIYTVKTSHEVIQDLFEKGTPDIATLKSGSTVSFFLNSNIGMYQRLGRYLESRPDITMKSYDEAAKRVQKSDGSYAFIMESPSSHFHVNSKPCDTVVSSGYLTTKSFAVALQKNSSYKEMVDHGVLVMMESGTLRKLYEKWWHNYSDTCEDPNMDILPKVYNKSLRLHEVSGVFYILILSTLISVAAALVEKKFASTKQITLD